MNYSSNKYKKLPHIKIDQTQQQNQKNDNWFFRLFVDLFLGFVSAGIEILATAFLGPVGGMIVGVVSDIGANMLADIINGDDPLSKENLIFNITFSALSIPGRIKGINKINKNKINILGNIDKNKQYQKLTKELNNIDLDNIHDLNKLNRKYEQIISKHDIDFEKIISEELFIKTATKQNTYKKILNNYSKGLRVFNKVLNFTDPAFAFNRLVNFVFKPVKQKINKKISSFFKTIKSKFFKQIKKKTRNILIPLNHTHSPWIKGIKLLPITNSINFFHIIVFFDKNLTNKKEPVYLFNKPWINIKKFLDSSSAGAYYINNIAWGWKIGSLIRKNNHFKHLSKMTIFSSSYFKSFNISVRTLKTITKTTQKLIDIEETISNWKNKDNYVQGFAQGLTTGVKGFSLIKPVIRTYQTKNNMHLVRYGSRFAKKQLNKTIKKSVKTKINNLVKDNFKW